MNNIYINKSCEVRLKIEYEYYSISNINSAEFYYDIMY